MSRKPPDELFPKIKRFKKNISGDLNVTPEYPILDFDDQPTPFIDAVTLFPKLAVQIAGYFEIREDLNRGIESLKRIPFLGTNDDVVLEALFTNAITHYGRCFVQADRRMIKLSLDNHWIKKGTKEEKTHEQVMHLRHQLLSHAGHTLFKETKVYLLVDDDQKPTLLKGINTLGKGLTTADFGTTLRFIAHFELLAERVKMKLDLLCARLTAQAKEDFKLSPD